MWEAMMHYNNNEKSADLCTYANYKMLSWQKINQIASYIITSHAIAPSVILSSMEAITHSIRTYRAGMWHLQLSSFISLILAWTVLPPAPLQLVLTVLYNSHIHWNSPVSHWSYSALTPFTQFEYICDWILENWPNCHTWPIAFYCSS